MSDTPPTPEPPEEPSAAADADAPSPPPDAAHDHEHEHAHEHEHEHAHAHAHEHEHEPVGDAAPATLSFPLPWQPTLGLLILWALAFGGGVGDMIDHWFAPKSYYAHGPLVPLVVGWMLWRDRDALARAPRRPSAAGFVLVALALLVSVVGHLEEIKVLLNLALLLSLYGLAWVLFGAAALRRAWVPALFLLFMVPLPGFVIDRLTFGLKMLAAKLSVLSIHAAGIPAILDGGTIHLAETDVLVDDVCSGLKTMVALVGFSVVFAYLQATRVKALLILALAIPVAIVANVVRILLLCWLAAVGSEAAFKGPLHDATGLLVYALALVLFLGVQALPLPAAEPPDEAGAEPEEEPPPPPPAVELPRRAHWGGLYGAAVLGAALLLLSLQTGQRGPARETQVTARIPARIGPWESTEVRLTEEVYRILGTRDAVFRRYTRSASTTTVDLYVTYAAGDIFRVAHPPERCFAGGGYTEQARRVIEVEVGDRRLSVNRILFRRDVDQVLVYYWYRLNGRDVAAYTQYRFGSLLRRLQRYDSSGSMIRLSTPIDARGEVEAERRLQRFVQEALPAALEPIGD